MEPSKSYRSTLVARWTVVGGKDSLLAVECGWKELFGLRTSI